MWPRENRWCESSYWSDSSSRVHAVGLIELFALDSSDVEICSIRDDLSGLLKSTETHAPSPHAGLSELFHDQRDTGCVYGMLYSGLAG